MDLLRKNMNKVLWFITILFVGGIFFWFGTGSPNTGAVAQVGKERIDIADYQQTLTRQLSRIREEYKQDLTQEQILQVRREVLSSMVNQELRYQEALRMGIKVPDEEIIQTIKSLPQFQENKVFNFELYRQALRFSLNIVPDEFEDLIRRDLAIRKLERMILSAIRVTPAEVELHFISEHGSLDDFAEMKQQYESNLLQNKRSQTYSHWIRNLHQRYNIEINPQLAGISS